MPKHAEFKDLRGRAVEAYAQHGMVEEPSRSFRFRKPGTSAYLFVVTWTPGNVSLAGDVGELQVVHYNALADFESGMYWLKGACHDYLFEKCPGLSMEYDRDATFAHIKESLNLPVIEALNGRKEPAWYGREPRRVPGYRQELQDWRRRVKREREEEVPEDEIEEKPVEEDPRKFTRKAESLTSFKRHSEVHDPLDYWHVPDCWEPWVRAWLWTIGRRNYFPSFGEQPDEVLKRDERQRILDEIEGSLENRHDAIDVLQSLGFDDYYGTDKYPSQYAFQYEALQFAAEHICASFTHAWGDPVC